MKNILSAVRGWVVVGVLMGVGEGALGQPKWKYEIYPFKANNCIGFTSMYTDPDVIKRKFNWTGQCKNGYLNGAGTLSYEVGTTSKNFWTAIAILGYRENGASLGINLSTECLINTNKARTENSTVECLYLNLNSAKEFGRYTNELNRDNPDSIAKRAELVDKMEPFVSDIASINISEIRSLLNSWAENPKMTVGDFKKFKPSAVLGRTNEEDPKVFGRGARGG